MSIPQRVILALSFSFIASPILAMNRKNLTKRPFRLLLFSAIKNDDTNQAARLLLEGAKLKVKAKKN